MRKNSSPPFKYLLVHICFQSVLAMSLLLCNPGQGYAGKTDNPVIYIVKRGDTLNEIALTYKVSVGQLRRWNRLRGDKIFEGQRLELWPRGSSLCYVVRSGDTLSEIADQCGGSLATLRSLNHIYRDRIYPGQKLKLARPLETAEAEDEPFEYIVKKGDNLSTIAQRFDVGLRLLRQLNRLKGDRIYPGQRLQLRPSSLDEGVHVVRPGETLSSIALKYRVKLSELRQLNDIEGSKILVGQKLRLKTTPAHVHIVERGDALWEIARAYGISVRELKRLNGLTANRIFPGQELYLSVKQLLPPDCYTVKAGDYLGRIARMHQMSVSELKRVNNIRRSVIYPGEKLKVNPILRRGREWLKISEINWDNLMNASGDVRRIRSENGPYFGRSPKAAHQRHARYFEGPSLSLRRSYLQARKLWQTFKNQVDSLGRLSDTLNGWHFVLDPGHGGLDPGAVVENLDGNGNRLYVVEDEYVYDIALRVYVLLRLHGAKASMTLVSPNHLIRHSDPPARTFVNEKNEVYNSYELNKRNSQANWPKGGRNGNLSYRVKLARKAFEGVPRNRCIFFSFHADIDHGSPEAPLVLYYKSKNSRRVDSPSKNFARSILPALGAGAYARGQNLSVLRNNPARVKVILELRNLAYTDHAWALRFEQLRQRDAEKVVRGVLDYVSQQG